jgi:hypothetical protein
MRLVLILLVIVLAAASFVADYMWRKWIADQKRGRQ